MTMSPVSWGMRASARVFPASWLPSWMLVCSMRSESPDERVAMSRKETTEGRSRTDAIRMAPLTLGLTTWLAPAR